MRHILIILTLINCFSCKRYLPPNNTNEVYSDRQLTPTDTLFAVTSEPPLEFGVPVAYLNRQGDTIIPFGQFAYLGSDTLIHYAKVSGPKGSVGIDRAQRLLFHLVFYDNAPDEFSEGLMRVKRNGKMGFVNTKGQIVIPCQYGFASPFQNGKSRVTDEARFYRDLEDHLRVEGENWYYINKQGIRVEQ